MKSFFKTLLVTLLALIVAFPFLYMVSTSFFSPADFRAPVARLLPSSFSFENYKIALGQRYFPSYIINSVSTSLITAVARTLTVIFAAFAFSHLDFKGRRVIFTLLVSTAFIPQEALLYQNYTTITSLGLLDSWAGIVLPSLFSATQLLLLFSAFSSIDRDYYDAGRIDGAKDMRYIFSILLPLTQSILITIMLQSLISTFNSYLWPLLVTNKPKARTLQVALSMMGFREEGKVGAEAASIVIATMPFLILLGFFKKRINEALSTGSLEK